MKKTELLIPISVEKKCVYILLLIRLLNNNNNFFLFQLNFTTNIKEKMMVLLK